MQPSVRHGRALGADTGERQTWNGWRGEGSPSRWGRGFGPQLVSQIGEKCDHLPGSRLIGITERASQDVVGVAGAVPGDPLEMSGRELDERPTTVSRISRDLG